MKELNTQEVQDVAGGNSEFLTDVYHTVTDSIDWLSDKAPEWLSKASDRVNDFFSSLIDTDDQDD